MRDGQRVSYIGNPDDGLSVGDHGKVLSSGGGGSHVQWTTGDRAGHVDLIDDADLVLSRAATRVAAVADSIDDSLHFGASVSLAVRETYDSDGPTGLLNALNESGHLAGLSGLAEEALDLVAARVRDDEDLAVVLGQLDSDEREAVISLTSAVILRDAFGDSDV